MLPSLDSSSSCMSLTSVSFTTSVSFLDVFLVMLPYPPANVFLVGKKERNPSLDFEDVVSIELGSGALVAVESTSMSTSIFLLALYNRLYVFGFGTADSFPSLLSRETKRQLNNNSKIYGLEDNRFNL